MSAPVARRDDWVDRRWALVRPRGSVPAWLRSTWLSSIGVGNLLATAVLAVAASSLIAGQPTRAPVVAYLLLLTAILPLSAMRRFPGPRRSPSRSPRC